MFDISVRLTNETRLRGYMQVRTDRGLWRVDYQGEPAERGCFRLYHRLDGRSPFEEWPETFLGDPSGMRRAIDTIEDTDAVRLGGDLRVWRIHFAANVKQGLSPWTLSWQATEADVFGHMFDELESGEL